MSDKTVKVKIKCDASDLIQTLSELNLYLRNFGKFYSGLQNLLLDIDKFPSKSSKLVRVESSPAGRTAVLVTLKPTDLLLNILSACRTGQFNDVFVNAKSHKTTSSKERKQNDDKRK